MDSSSNKVPVTILTGFLGSGKQLYLIVSYEQHGKRIAVLKTNSERLVLIKSCNKCRGRDL